MLFGLLTLAADTAPGDPVTTAIAGAIGLVITALTGAQTAQLSGIRHDFQAYRADQDKRMSALEGRVEVLEEAGEVTTFAPSRPPRKKVTGSHSTARGKKPTR